MPTKVYWYLANRIIVNEHLGDVKSEVLVRAVEVTLEMASTSDERFHLLIDARKLGAVPNNIGQLNRIARNLLKNDNLDVVLIITSNSIHKFIGNLVIQLLRKTTQVVGTVEEALIILQRLDTRLPNLSEIRPDYESAIEIT